MSQLEAASEEFNNKTLVDEIQKTNEFVGMYNVQDTKKFSFPACSSGKL